MLFHTWPFLVFLLIVLPVFFLLRRTRLWIPWLMAASYFFYGWWNPWYLILVVYSTTLDYLLVTLMDHSLGGRASWPAGRFENPGSAGASSSQNQPRFKDSVLLWAFIVSSLLTVGIAGVAVFGPPTLRPTMIVFGV